MDYNIEQACLTITQHSNFEPEFCICCSVEEVADCINKPHEDYPDRVPATKDVIEDLVELFSAGAEGIHQLLLRQIHGYVFQDTSHAGGYRNYDVHPEGKEFENSHRMVYVPHYLIPEKLKMILPINLCDFPKDREKLLQDIKLWYKAFQTIHPFCDGNGRVGGIIAAVIWHFNYGKDNPDDLWLGPEQ